MKQIYKDTNWWNLKPNGQDGLKLTQYNISVLIKKYL